MPNFQWKRFNFFDVTRDFEGSNLAEMLEDSAVTTTTSGRGHLIVGDSGGFVYFLEREGLCPRSLKAFDLAVLRAQQLKQRSLLVLVGLDHHHSDPGLSAPYLKVYDADKADPKTGNPLRVRVSKIRGVTNVTSLSVHEDQNLIALGFGDGTVQLWRGDVTRDRGTKVKTLRSGGEREASVTGLALRTSGSGTFLYVSTQNDVYSFNVSARDKEIKVHLDKLGCTKGLSVPVDMSSDTHFAMGRSDAVYCYNSECRTQCYAFEGDKSVLYWFRNYLVVVSSSGGSEKVVLSIFDVQNKFIAFNGEVPKVSALLAEWGNLYALTGTELICFVEKDTQTKLDILFKKNFYDIAIKIAKNQRYDADGLVDIFRQYGDHLYVKGEYQGAIENYCKTIGRLEPSYVIRRFLDAQRIENLTAYLQSLHRQGAANEDHTTLLLNCYTKLKDEEKLDEFIMTKDREIDFDLDIAIKVCRQAGYFNHALALARKHDKHEWYLKIQLEDRKNYSDAVEYISKLNPSSAEENLRKYGSILISSLPQETTNLVIKCCRSVEVLPEEFIHLFITKPQEMILFLESVLEFRMEETTPVIYNTLLEYYLTLLPETENKVLDLLRTGDCDTDHALILCKNAFCMSGLLYLYEKKRIYDEILSYHIREGNVEAAVETCRKFGSEDPRLWISALRLFPNQTDTTPEIMTEILERIEAMKLMNPLEVISCLTSTPGATLGLVRDYLLRFLESERKVIDENHKAILEYQAETQKIREKISTLETEPIVFQCSKCSACSRPLELPSVHFLCKHSFHRQCFSSFSESENECPVCYEDNKKILDIIRSQEQNKAAHDAFHYQLETAHDGFSVVAEYFGRGLFRTDEDLLSIVTEATRNMAADSYSPMTLSDNLGDSIESRIRLEENLNSREYSIPSEARLRTNQVSSIASEVSESRLRSQVNPSNIDIVSDARLRLNEGSTSRQNHKSPSLNKKSTRTAKLKKELNPFEERVESVALPSIDLKNPFFEEPSNAEDSNNPFGDPEGYDDKLNPFA